LVHLGEYESVGEVFGALDSPISKDSTFYVRNEAPDVLEVIKIVRNAGGVPVIAHPLARTSSEDEQPAFFPRRHFEAMVAAGLLGLETKHREVSASTREVLEAFAAEHGLITTGSSDYHGLSVKEHNPLGLHSTSIEMLKRILEVGTGTKPTLNHNF
jgi:predicted metal-dependent phosphoesterase TrpH